VRIGAIVPVHGDAPYLAEALDSILTQVPPPDEIVVVDDGSPRSVTLKPEHAARCELVRLEARRGPAPARQAALEMLACEVVALCDADDAWEPGKLAVQREALDRSPNAAVCFGRALVVGPDGAPTGERMPELEAGVFDADDLVRLVYRHNPIPNSSAAIRRAPLEAAGGFRSSPHADIDLWLRLAARGESFVHEPRARVRYRRHSAGMTADVSRLAEGLLEVHAEHAGLVDQHTRRRVEASDHILLARGRIRERRYREARAALAHAARLEPLGPSERLLRLLVAVPGARAALGRRDPYRRLRAG
jgi:hypothetical protein